MTAFSYMQDCYIMLCKINLCVYLQSKYDLKGSQTEKECNMVVAYCVNLIHLEATQEMIKAHFWYV